MPVTLTTPGEIEVKSGIARRGFHPATLNVTPPSGMPNRAAVARVTVASQLTDCGLVLYVTVARLEVAVVVVSVTVTVALRLLATPTPLLARTQ